MKDFKLRMTREVVTIDEYFVTVQAETAEEAEAQGAEIACDMNSSCPDGTRDTGEMECRSWGVDRVEEAVSALPGEDDAL